MVKMIIRGDATYLQATNTWIAVWFGSLLEGFVVASLNVLYAPVLNVVFFVFLGVMRFDLIREGTAFLRGKARFPIILQMAGISVGMSVLGHLSYHNITNFIHLI